MGFRFDDTGPDSLSPVGRQNAVAAVRMTSRPEVSAAAGIAAARRSARLGEPGVGVEDHRDALDTSREL